LVALKTAKCHVSDVHFLFLFAMTSENHWKPTCLKQVRFVILCLCLRVKRIQRMKMTVAKNANAAQKAGEIYWVRFVSF
jgi:hypothetical protein